MQKLEGFHYATALDINMGYYTIRISPETQDMKTIVIGFGKFRYNRLAMGMCASSDIFQEKVDDLIGGTKCGILPIFFPVCLQGCCKRLGHEVLN